MGGVWVLTLSRWHRGTMQGPLLGPAAPPVSARTSPAVGAEAGAAFWPLSWLPGDDVTWEQEEGESQAWATSHLCSVLVSSFEKSSKLKRGTGLKLACVS